MVWQQWVLMALYMFSIGVTVARSGETKTTEYTGGYVGAFVVTTIGLMFLVASIPVG